MGSKLYYRWAAMNAGKSTQLLQVAHNYAERGMGVTIYTSGLDTRSGLGKVGSRLGVSRDAMTFDAATVFCKELVGADSRCVLVDEAQFLKDAQVRQLHRLAHTEGVPVIAYGLRTDFRGVPFEGSSALLAIADDLEELKTICTCGRKATLNIRIDAEGRRVRDGEQVSIGGNDSYRSVCGRCFYLEG